MIKKIFPKQIGVYKATVILSILFGYVYNIPLIIKFFQDVAQDSTFSLWFVISCFAVCFLAFFLIFNLINFRYIFKPLMIVLIAIGAIVFYSEMFLGITFTYGVVESIFDTNTHEALSYLSIGSVASFIFFGVLPIVILLRVKIVYPKFSKSALIRIANIVGTLILVVMILITNVKTIFPFFRNHNELGDYPNPIIYVGITSAIIAEKFIPPLPYQPIGDGAKEVRNTDKPNLMVFVLGETARMQNYQYNGYDRDTNPYTKNLGVIALQDVASCGTYTALSVPCMLSNMPRVDYNARQAAARDNVLDIMKKAGLDVTWYNNNGYDCRYTGVCKRIENIYINTSDCKGNSAGGFCHDSVLLKELKENLAKNDDGKSKVIVLHLVGSHGPTYYQRYPAEFKKFTPTCDQGDINACSREKLVNTYDNTIRYTDYILSKVIDTLDSKKVTTKYDSAMVYISDHGESLGEDGLYLHAAPYGIAPLYQKRVPWIMWFSKDFLKDNKLNKACLINEAKKEDTFSQDNVFDSFLGLMNIKTAAYSPKLDIFANCRNGR
ncbi:phosphoethanolamine transferase [Francisella philomiragia]|uniref:phosphoethanolamine transferase n=1 Tax=Francisella philomiragia TaxID=28110 RepID=UPI002244B545|nr:phosphoethanolamine--lipid A transferase [Francisella philomiragia]